MAVGIDGVDDIFHDVIRDFRRFTIGLGVKESLDDLGVEAVLGIDDEHTRVHVLLHEVHDGLVGSTHALDAVAEVEGIITHVVVAAHATVEEEIIGGGHDVGVGSGHFLGNLQGLALVLVEQTDSHFQFHAVGHLDPLGDVSAIHGILAAGIDLVCSVLESIDIVIQFLEDGVEDFLLGVVLRGEGAAVTGLGRLGERHGTVEVGIQNGQVVGQHIQDGRHVLILRLVFFRITGDDILDIVLVLLDGNPLGADAAEFTHGIVGVGGAAAVDLVEILHNLADVIPVQIGRRLELEIALREQVGRVTLADGSGVGIDFGVFRLVASAENNAGKNNSRKNLKDILFHIHFSF